VCWSDEADEFEKSIANSNSLKNIRKTNMIEDVSASLAPPIKLLTVFLNDYN